MNDVSQYSSEWPLFYWRHLKSLRTCLIIEALSHSEKNSISFLKNKALNTR